MFQVGSIPHRPVATVRPVYTLPIDVINQLLYGQNESALVSLLAFLYNGKQERVQIGVVLSRVYNGTHY
jgi:hypothetical protein